MTFDRLPEDIRPRDFDEAYAAQDAFQALQLGERADRRIAGRKIALTSQVMQQLLGIDQPCAGAIFSDRVHLGEATLRGADHVHIGVEGEIGVRLAADLPPTGRPYDREGVAAAVGALMAAIQIVEDRNADYTRPDLLTGIADNAWNAGCVLGPKVADWRGLDLEDLRGRMAINGAVVAEGRGRDVLGHPFEALAWLANHMCGRGATLRAGDIVLTGSVVPTRWPGPGDEVRVTFDGLGEAVLRMA